MKISGMAKEFIIIGENIHTTRIVLRNGKRVTTNPEGVESVVYTPSNGENRFLVVPEHIKRGQDYEEGRVKHVKIAVQAAMSSQKGDACEGMEYLKTMVRRQEETGADFLDINVDEVSLRPDEQKTAMKWLVGTVQGLSSLPMSIDSSNIETIQAGLEACDSKKERPLLNSAYLERIEALDLAKQHNARVIVTAAGGAGMPQNDEERIENASRMVDAALANGIAIQDIYIDALVFPISVDSQFGNHCLLAIRRLREKYGHEIHITGGLSNVSFGLPCRNLINDTFIILSVEAGGDSGIVDPVASHLDKVFSSHRQSRPYQLTEDMLLGKDQNCKNFLRAYRKGELQAGK